MDSCLKFLAKTQSYNSALSMAIISKPNWCNHSKRSHNKCTFCDRAHYWTSHNLYYYTNIQKDNQHYLFCEPCAADLEQSISTYHLCHYLFNSIDINQDVLKYIKQIYFSLYLGLKDIPFNILNDFRLIKLEYNLICSMDELSNENVIQLAKELGIHYSDHKNIWTLISVICDRREKLRIKYMNYLNKYHLEKLK